MSPDPRIPAGWPALPFREAEARLTAPGAPFAITTIAIRGVPTRIWEKAPPTLGDLFKIAYKLVSSKAKFQMMMMMRRPLLLAKKIPKNGNIRDGR